MGAQPTIDARAAGLFRDALPLVRGVYLSGDPDASENELHTSAAFSEKWATLQQDATDEEEGWKQFQFRWYLTCYGYDTEADFATSLAPRRVILDAGCGPGYKAAWFARLNPDATVVAMDLSDSIFVAAQRYGHLPNLLFVKGDIAATPFNDGAIEFLSCDQVLHHTDSPPDTVKEFARILAPGGLLNTYVYAKKSLPRELLDEHLRDYAKDLSSEQIWELSDQLTRLGKALSELNISLDVPDVPALGIKGGRQDLQRFIYWNFIKCFWNPEHGFEASKLINFDWYAPSTAFRYSLEEFTNMLAAAGFVPRFLHSEEACHSGRFGK
ncbi:MAG TPA: class I SAM-dependent methyltransferase [Allosphingosinicella sp.]|jgi:SAM-dependent methyltransferase